MSNLSKIRREKMIEFLETLKEQHSDDESLIAINQIEKELVSKRYGLVWEEHEEAVDVMMRDNIPVFTEVKEREICMVPGEDYNFLLEGDNLHSLHLLEKTHKGRIQMIYIDPPYNTGNKDFTYDDMLIDGMDGYRHSKWLSFIALRLKLAKALLTEEGLIFISIDDNEMANLKLLCDEIFGEVNYVANIIVKSNPRGSQSKKEIASVNEYILVYAKDIRYSAIIGHKLTDDMVSEYKCSDAKGAYRLLGLRQRGGFWRASERPNLFYPFYVNTKNASISLIEDKSHNTAIYPIQPSTGEKGTWRWSKEKAEKEIELLVAKEVKRGQEIVWDIYQKDYMGSDGGIRRTKAKSLWDEKEVNYQNAANELKDIFGISPFTYAKPSYLIKRAMEMIDFSKNSIVLDFFAGSGTTAQAVLELNKEDGGQRKFILCT
ncbi:MAG TPA: site-specific DNA-methyltransferase, partial [Roseburia sp.]|nr:site-specific DNA-methyltransferase [Roseburia sp.]